MACGVDPTAHDTESTTCSCTVFSISSTALGTLLYVGAHRFLHMAPADELGQCVYTQTEVRWSGFSSQAHVATTCTAPCLALATDALFGAAVPAVSRPSGGPTRWLMLTRNGTLFLDFPSCTWTNATLTVSAGHYGVVDGQFFGIGGSQPAAWALTAQVPEAGLFFPEGDPYLLIQLAPKIESTTLLFGAQGVSSLAAMLDWTEPRLADVDTVVRTRSLPRDDARGVDVVMVLRGPEWRLLTKPPPGFCNSTHGYLPVLLDRSFHFGISDMGTALLSDVLPTAGWVLVGAFVGIYEGFRDGGHASIFDFCMVAASGRSLPSPPEGEGNDFRGNTLNLPLRGIRDIVVFCEQLRGVGVFALYVDGVVTSYTMQKYYSFVVADQVSTARLRNAFVEAMYLVCSRNVCSPRLPVVGGRGGVNNAIGKRSQGFSLRTTQSGEVELAGLTGRGPHSVDRIKCT